MTDGWSSGTMTAPGGSFTITCVMNAIDTRAISHHVPGPARWVAAAAVPPGKGIHFGVILLAILVLGALGPEPLDQAVGLHRPPAGRALATSGRTARARPRSSAPCSA